jgi:hypothetical protein
VLSIYQKIIKKIIMKNNNNCVRFGLVFWVGITMTFVSLLSGCSSGGIAGLTSCEGVVNLNGQPLENASVTFIPITATSNRSAGGMTDAQGHYKLFTNTNAGILPGEYKVTITKSIPATEKDALLVKEMTNATEQNKGVIPSSYDDVTVNFKSLTGKYANQQTSDLIVTVSNNGNRQQNFDLVTDEK